ncbi:MAG: hypothetical protein ACK4SJ_01820 [Sphingorhabdus sp.]|nr:hypothetical protein [Sphingorhabdus sp.]
MEVTSLVAKLVLVQSLALVSEAASLSAPALRPHTSAPAQSTISKSTAAEVSVINPTATNQSAPTDPSQASMLSKEGKTMKRRVFVDGKDGASREYWIVEYQ